VPAKLGVAVNAAAKVAKANEVPTESFIMVSIS
jgi:hypothetical protein